LNLTGKIERKILMAFDAIHSHGVVHGDIRSANILVDQDGKSVWVIDFEFAEVLTDGSDKEVRILQENEEIQRVLREIKSTRDQMASC
jgi:serine/threonine protein kinase